MSGQEIFSQPGRYSPHWKYAVTFRLDQKESMTSKIKKTLAAFLALAALALGGAAIASATNGGVPLVGSSQEKSEGAEAPDPGEAVSSAVAAKAKAAAESRTGATAQSVQSETSDGTEQDDTPESGGESDSPTPAGTTYEVDLTKGSTEYKVSLDSNFKVLHVETEQAD